MLECNPQGRNENGQRKEDWFYRIWQHGAAIAKGLLEAKVCKAEQLYACAAHFEKLKDTADRLGVHPMQTAQEVVQNSDVVILAVKPYLIEQVVAPLKELLKGKMVVSVAAGFTFARYQQLLDESTTTSAPFPTHRLRSVRVS